MDGIQAGEEDEAVPAILDWIGLFPAEEKDPLAFMDYRGFGACGPQQGAVDWRINGEMLAGLEAEDRRNNNNGENTQNGEKPGKTLEFRYFNGISGSLRASSPQLLVYSDAQLAISSLVCHGLRSSRRSSHKFYAKLNCSGSSTRVYKTSSSPDGQWTSLNFLFPADRSAELRIRVKAERGWPAAGKLVGEANIPLLDLLGDTANSGRHFSLLLRPQCQQIQLKCRLVPPIREPLAETMQTLGTIPVADPNGNLLPAERLAVPPANGQLSNSASSSATSSSSSSAGMGQSICSSSSSSSRFCANAKNASLASKLPPGWEVRVDGQGRVFFMDHIRHKTAWNPPLILERSGEGEEATMARRTVFGGNEGQDEANGNGTAAGDVAETRRTSQQSSPSKALQFLRRDDLFGNLLQANENALQLYNGSPFLKHILQRVRREPAKFGQFEKNRELIDFVNSFADQTQPLPIGWQLARQSGQGHSLFVDHSNRLITPFDPRLPEPSRPQGCRSAPPVRRKKCHQNGVPANGGQLQRRQGERHNLEMRRYSGGIWSWELTEKADQIQALLAEHCPEVAQRVSAKLRLIGQMGELALLRYANDPDLVRAISLLEQLEARGELLDSQEGAEPKSQFELTLAKFHSALEKAGYGKGPSRIRFRLRRDRLMEDAFQKILGANACQLRKCQMTVSFSEEEGLDYGGPSRELFFLLSRELFHPRHGLFEYADSHKVQISAMSKFVDQCLRWMELCGRLLGLALVHRCLLDCFFTRPFYKMLAQIPLLLEDLRESDSQLFHSLSWLRQNPVSADLDLTFSVTEELAGEVIQRDLVPNGREVAVTEGNKQEFIRHMLHWRAERGVREQSKALLRGLNAVIEPELLGMFDADQLELALSGTVQIDLADWERHTEYRGGYHPGHVVVRWFWLCVHQMRNADRLRLLQFVTGSSSVPFEGFKGLRGSNGPKRFCIERWGNEDSLPRAHTCFNRLDLPAYPNRQKLLAKLMLAITESSSYAIE